MKGTSQVGAWLAESLGHMARLRTSRLAAIKIWTWAQDFLWPFRVVQSFGMMYIYAIWMMLAILVGGLTPEFNGPLRCSEGVAPFKRPSFIGP